MNDATSMSPGAATIVAPHDMDVGDPRPDLAREWLVTNGLGGYASGTVAGPVTRRYHGILVAALEPPFGRTLMLNHIAELVRLPDGRSFQLGGDPAGDDGDGAPAARLAAFRLDLGLPVWRFELDGFAIEKRVLMPYLHNTVHVSYRVVAGEGTLRLKIRPALHFRPYEAPVDRPFEQPYAVRAVGDRIEIHGIEELPPLRLRMTGVRTAFTLESRFTRQVLYRVEESRGYAPVGDLWSPGHYRTDLTGDEPVVLCASVEPWETIDGLSPAAARAAERGRREALLALARVGDDDIAAQLVLAADQFIITPQGRTEEAARARAEGEELRTIIAGYHWFTDWGRDTMISLDGLTLATRRHREAAYILRTFALTVRDGLIPNLFPDGSKKGLYHTADATLWFFHAVHRYLERTGDRATLRVLLPTLREIWRHHVAGTRFGIGVDPRDGLLRQGEPGYPLTWMDAQVGDWVVTPRRGKAVEINALWYNALRVLEHALEEEEGPSAAEPVRACAERARAAFDERFWYDEGGYLYDVVDGENGDDAACRPNQILAISLPHAVLRRERHAAVLDVVRERLLTPVGLRSLAPDQPNYKPNYHGDLRTRDGAYHQGTVWGWLIGPYIDAHLRVDPDDVAGARRLLDGLVEHLDEFGAGSIAEIFDAEPPFTPRGCIAQAWSVAEALRCWLRLRTAGGGEGQSENRASNHGRSRG
jgi:predicted glycogen debranching enzyme